MYLHKSNSEDDLRQCNVSLTCKNRCIYYRYMKTLINIKADVEVKRRAQKIAKEIGIPLSTIINAYLKQFGREQRVNFLVPLRPNKKTAKLLRQASDDYRKKKNISPLFSTAEEMDVYLNS